MTPLHLGPGDPLPTRWPLQLVRPTVPIITLRCAVSRLAVMHNHRSLMMSFYSAVVGIRSSSTAALID